MELTQLYSILCVSWTGTPLASDRLGQYITKNLQILRQSVTYEHHVSQAELSGCA